MRKKGISDGINGRYLPHTLCGFCNEPLVFLYKYDALCCLRCDEWIEEQCKDLACGYCAGRPEVPSAALWQMEPYRNPYFYIQKYESRHKGKNRRLKTEYIRKRKAKKEE